MISLNSASAAPSAPPSPTCKPQPPQSSPQDDPLTNNYMHPEGIQGMEGESIRRGNYAIDIYGRGCQYNYKGLAQKLYVTLLCLVLCGSFPLGTSARPIPRGSPVTGPEAEGSFIFLGDSSMKKDGSLILAGGSSPSTVGRVFLNERFKFLETKTHNPASFDAGFVFVSTPSLASSPGDSLSFLITASRKSLKSQPVIAIKLDAGLNRVTLNAGLVYSAVSADTNKDGVNLRAGTPVTVWLEYRSNLKTLALWLNRTSAPLLVASNLDLTQFYSDYMYVGFSALNERGSGSVHTISYHRFIVVGYSSFTPPTEPEEPEGEKNAAPAPEIEVVMVFVLVMLCFLLCGYMFLQELIFYLRLSWYKRLKSYKRLNQRLASALATTIGRSEVESVGKLNPQTDTGRRFSEYLGCSRRLLQRRLRRQTIP